MDTASNRSRSATSVIPWRELVMIPAAISLVVTLLRLTGELLLWSPRFFNREAGGPGSIVGIVWLVPVFGIYFAYRLAVQGHAPAGRLRGLLLALAAILAVMALIAAVPRLGLGPLARVALFNVGAVIGAGITYLGWPHLARTNVVYGYLARIPVAVVMLIAMSLNWGTHYELGPPGFPEMGVFAKWLWIGLLPQMVFWIGFTVVIGGLFGGAAYAIFGSRWSARARMSVGAPAGAQAGG